MSNLEALIDQPQLCRWPEEWTNKVNALKKFMGEARCIEEFRNEIQMMNCMKMYGLDITHKGICVCEITKVEEHLLCFGTII